MNINAKVASAALAGILAISLAGAASANSNLVVNGDFSAGNTGFSTGYALTTMTPDLFQNGVHGIYAVIPIGDVAGQSAYGDWNKVTVDPSGGDGNVYVADGATDPGVTVWSQTVAVKVNSDYTFSFDAAEISDDCCSNTRFSPTVGGMTGPLFGLVGSWQTDTVAWNSGSNTSVVLSLTDDNTDGNFNDFVLTDIAFVGPAAVPEPATWAMMLVGFAGLGAAMRSRRRGAATA